MKTLFDFDGPFMRAMRDFSYLVELNLLTLLCCLPVVSCGAALQAMHYVMMQMIEGSEGHIASTYFKQFKADFKSALPISLVFACFSLLLCLEVNFAGQIPQYGQLLMICSYALIFIMLSLLVWVIPLGAKFVYSFSGVFHNALYLAVTKAPRTIIMDALMCILPMLFLRVPQLWPVALFIGISLPSYLCALIYYPVFKRIISEK